MFKTGSKDQHAFARLQLKAYLEAKGIRYSKSREHIFELLLRSKTHLELADILAQARKLDIGEATVYRALKTFQEALIVTRLEMGSGQICYEITNGHHDHMVCSSCGQVIEFHSELIENLQRQIAAQHGFLIQSHRHDLRGLCARCHS
ncbi:Fur family transcriptional regulator [Bdellovibrionota bacterium FG-1]